MHSEPPAIPAPLAGDIWNRACWSKVKVKVAQSCPTLCNPMDYTMHGILSGQNTGVRSLSLLQGIFPIQGSNPGLPHGRRILYHLSHKGSPRILEWVAYPFSSRSSQPRNQTRVFCITGRFFTNWAIREAHWSKADVNLSWGKSAELLLAPFMVYHSWPDFYSEVWVHDWDYGTVP